MGLDMSLYRLSASVEVPEYPNVKSLAFGERGTEDEEKATQAYWDATEKLWDNNELEDVAYWRKFNALHAWFVDECQDGIDNCQYGEVSEDKLQELSQLLADSLETKEVKLEPQGGFFFGSTDVDEYYWESVQDAFDKICEVLTTTDFDTQRILYSSSW